MVTFYFTLAIIVLLLWYGGLDGTLRLFAYVDLQIRYAGIQAQLSWMRWKLKKQLIKDTTEFQKFLQKEDKYERNI